MLSTLGVIAPPRPAVAATELVQVLRPGGRLGMCAWTSEGMRGDFFRALRTHAPPPPEFAQPPLPWGAEVHARGLFAGTGLHVEFEREDRPRGAVRVRS